jgi:hypothetical protein
MPTFPSRHARSWTPRCHRARPYLEALESRLAPATLVSPTRLTYQDTDGDHVSVTFSQPILNADNVNAIFTFSSGADAVNGSNAVTEQLRKIDLSATPGAAGTTITTSATRSTVKGDGHAALGMIDASGIDLGAVTIDGDLGKILAGDATTTTPGLKGLTAYSLGANGTSTGADDLNTVIRGQLGFLRVKTDVKEAFLDIQGGPNGDLGSVRIGGSLVGGATANAGSIVASGDVGNVAIGGNIAGDAGADTGNVFADGTMGTVTVGGSLQGSGGDYSGRICALGAMGAVKIAGDLQGGAGFFSGLIDAESTLAGLTVGGSVRGGSGQVSAQVSVQGALGAVKITGDFLGGAGRASALLDAESTLASVTIGGSVHGSTGDGSGQIYAQGAVGAVKITGDLLGGATSFSGSVSTKSTVASVTIGGSVVGGSASWSGAIIATGAVGTVTIRGDVKGGTAGAGDLTLSGAIEAKRIGRLVIGGSLSAGVDSDPTAGIFQDNGAVVVADDIGSATLGSLAGSSSSMALLSARGSATPTASTDLAIGKLTIKGNVKLAQIRAGFDLYGAAVNADAQIGTVRVGGDWEASSLAAGAMPGGDGFYGDGDANEGKMAGPGVKDVATVSSQIGSLSIGGQARGTDGGTDFFGIVAENVVTLKVHGKTVPLKAGNSNDDVFVGLTGDFKVHEI